VETRILITHGTDTMVETAAALAAAAAAGPTGKTIVLTGAMVPYAFGSSDGLFNLGSALSFRAGAAPRRLPRDERPLLRLGIVCGRIGTIPAPSKRSKHVKDTKANRGHRGEHESPFGAAYCCCSFVAFVTFVSSVSTRAGNKEPR